MRKSIAGLGLAVFLPVWGGDEKPLRDAIGRLGDSDFGVRQEAQERLLNAALESPEQVLALLPADPPDPEVRAGIETLRRRIPVERLRRRILAALDGQTGKDDLARELAERPSPMAFLDFATTAAVDPAPKIAVLEIVLREADPSSRPMAWVALQQLQLWKIVPEGLRPEIVRVVLERLPPKEEDFRVKAVEILGDATTAERAVEHLSPLLAADDSARHAAASALIRLLRGKSRPLVEKLVLSDPDLEGRATLLWNWCLAVEREDRIAFLRRFLEDPDPAVRMIGIGCFSAHAGPQDVGLLKPLLEGNDELRVEAEEARKHVLSREKDESE